MIGQTISHYKITEKLGEGGMGVVYKAEDTRLKRSVALKFLAPHLLRDEEGPKRFEREAMAAASLDHPNICTVHEIDEVDGRTFIVMAFLEGRTLSKKIAEGPLKLPEALSIAIQMAEGLDAAHEKGTTHRDIKPDNVMLMKGSRGLVKLMDFGLAQLAESSKLTREGTTLGTPVYMSPEQALGEPTDRRSDVWGLGVVLYEMVAGQPPFKGEVDHAVIYSITNEQPEPLTAVRTGVPKDLEGIVDKCLAKQAGERYQHVSDLLVDLQAARRALEPQASRVGAKPAPAKRTSPAILVAVATVVLGAVGLTWWLTRSTGTARSPRYNLSQITRDAGITLDPALSPDGKLLAYASDRQGEGDLNIWVEQLAGGEPIRLTKHAADDFGPSFSPDGSQIVFESDRDGGGIYVVSALGGNPRRVAGKGSGPRFSPDGASISFERTEVDTAAARFYQAIYVASASGGPARRVDINLASAAAPVWSPDGKYLLFTGSAEPSGFGLRPKMDWWTVPVEGGAAVPLGARDLFLQRDIQQMFQQRFISPHQWVADGNYVLFHAASGGGASNLWRVQISADGRRLIGEPQRLTSGTGEQDPSATQDGRIAFVNAIQDWDIWKLPIDANAAGVRGEPERVISGLSRDVIPSIPADARTLIYTSDRAGNDDIWLRDLATGRDTPITVSDTGEYRGEISPDGSRVVFNRRENDQTSLYVKDLATETEKRVLEGISSLMGWMPGGKKVLYYTPSPNVVFRVVDVDTGHVSDVGLEHPEYRSGSLRYSPRGDWLAFNLNLGASSGRSGIYVARVENRQPLEHSQWVEITSGRSNGHPWWSPDGNTIYFLSNRDEFACIWTQPLDAATKRPKGPLKVLRHLHGRQRIGPAAPALFGFAMTTDALYFPAFESRGNIWLAEPVGTE